MNFSNKVVLITGAGSGIGKAIAIRFAKLSATLTLIDIDGESLEKSSELCAKITGVKVLKHVIDVRNDELVQSVVKDTVEKLGRIDVVVNSAGIFNNGSILSPNTMQVFDKVMAVNLRAVVSLTTCAAPELIKHKGCIVNISSVAAHIPTDEFFAYNLSKSGVSHFTKCAALELASHGVRVNAVLPGIVDTNIFLNAGMTKEECAKTVDAVAKVTPMKRIIKAEEIADMVAFLASDTAESITGSCIDVDGGLALMGLFKVRED